MPRRPRRFEEDRVYHVYNRFSRSEPIFEETVEVGRFLNLLSEVKQTDGFALLAFCILPTHYRIAFRQGPVSLSRTMRSLQGRFSQSFNIRHRSNGPYGRAVSRQSVARLASVLGLHAESVSRQSSRGRVKLAEDPEFAQRFEDLDRTLAERAERESK